MLEGYLINLLIIIGIFTLLSTSLNLAVGYTGLLNLGHIAFFGIGAYSSALLTKAGWPFVVAFLLAGVIASVFGSILTFAVRKLKGDYLALATLGFSFVIYSLMLNWTSLTRGPLGIPGIAKPSIFGLDIKTNFAYLMLVVVVNIGVLWFLQRLTASRYGKLLEAVRDDAVGLSVLGKNPERLKVQAMMVSAFIAGLAGSLFAHYITFIDPSSFFIADLIVVFTMVMIGGLASLKGSVIATFIIILIPEILRFVDLSSSIIGPGRQIMYALILIMILMFRPKGLFGKVDLR